VGRDGGRRLSPPFFSADHSRDSGDRVRRQQHRSLSRQRSSHRIRDRCADRTIAELRHHSGLRAKRSHVRGGRDPDHAAGPSIRSELDLVLLDGPHAYPLPQVEFAYLFPRVRVGGWLVLDDIQIPSVHELFRFLTQESSVVLEEVIVRTAFFRE